MLGEKPQPREKEMKITKAARKALRLPTTSAMRAKKTEHPKKAKV